MFEDVGGHIWYKCPGASPDSSPPMLWPQWTDSSCSKELPPSFVQKAEDVAHPTERNVVDGEDDRDAGNNARVDGCDT